MRSDEALLSELSEATRGLLWMSESDYPFVVFKWDAGIELTHEYLRHMAGGDAETAVEERSVDDFFRVAASEPEWKGEAEIETAKRYQTLVRLLKDKLEDVIVYRVGEINIGVYIVGRSPESNWLGISTRVVET